MVRYYEDTASFPMQGGCTCGLIRYSISQAPLVVHCCHCTSCQRETGTAFAINALIESAGVEQLSPTKPMVPAGPNGDPPARPALPELTIPFVDPATASAPSSSIPLPYASIHRPSDAPSPQYITLPSESHQGQTVARCPRCGTCVWSHYGGGGPGIAFIRAGTLDEPWKIDPDVHIYTKSQRAFVAVGEGVPTYEQFYQDRKAFYRPDSLERFGKLMPEIRAYHGALKKAKM